MTVTRFEQTVERTQEALATGWRRSGADQEANEMTVRVTSPRFMAS